MRSGLADGNGNFPHSAGRPTMKGVGVVDPVTLIVAALVAGAAAGMGDTAS
jgi:hypothetical protein